MRLKFKAHPQRFPDFKDPKFVGSEGPWKDGDVREVDNGDEILKRWPQYFEIIAEAKAEPSPDNKMESPVENKGRRRGRPPKRGY